MRYDEEDEDEGPKADPTLEQGMPLPIRLNAVYPPELTAVPIEDIDPYYRNQRVTDPFHSFQSLPSDTIGNRIKMIRYRFSGYRRKCYLWGKKEEETA